METDNFAFLLPIMMGTFGIVFLLLSRLHLRLPSALAWGVAFTSGAMAFSVGLLPIDPGWQALLGDLLFFISFYAYGEGLLVRFGKPRMTALRVGFIVVCMVADAYIVFVLGSLEAELLLADTALTVLLAVPVIAVMRSPRYPVDQALVLVAALVALDTLVRMVMFNFVFGISDALADFTSTQYAFFMQVSAAALGLCFALSALGSVLVDIVAGYKEAAERDPLSGLLNRRGFEEALERGRFDPTAGAVLVCDIDLFKQVNDAFGHRTGDEVIVELSRQFTAALPSPALPARFGGEEFIAFIPGVDLAAAEATGERLRRLVAEVDWTQLGLDRKVTVSIGVARPVRGDRSIHDAIARADRAMYLAKAAGRNQVMTEAQVPSTTSTATGPALPVRMSQA